MLGFHIVQCQWDICFDEKRDKTYFPRTHLDYHKLIFMYVYIFYTFRCKG
jgi:hypothetical protein